MSFVTNLLTRSDSFLYDWGGGQGWFHYHAFVATSAFCGLLSFHRAWFQVVDFHLCWTAILSVIVLMKILSGQGIVEVLGLTVLYLFSLTLAYLINFFFNICFGFSAFVFKNFWGSNLLKTSIVAFMSGSLIPLAFFPKVVSAILSFLPFHP